jgi:hypothetical protein
MSALPLFSDVHLLGNGKRSSCFALENGCSIDRITVGRHVNDL